MFDVFGEFNSYEEINETAKGLLNEGDIESLKNLAKENGLDVEDAKDYADGIIDTLCTAISAAYGKLSIETAAFKPYEIENDWIDYIKLRISESEDVAKAVRKKGKSIKGCIGALLKWSYANAKSVDKDIVKASGISAGTVKLGIPSMQRSKLIITEYYTK